MAGNRGERQLQLLRRLLARSDEYEEYRIRYRVERWIRVCSFLQVKMSHPLPYGFCNPDDVERERSLMLKTKREMRVVVQ